MLCGLTSNAANIRKAGTTKTKQVHRLGQMPPKRFIKNFFFYIKTALRLDLIYVSVFLQIGTNLIYFLLIYFHLI